MKGGKKRRGKKESVKGAREMFKTSQQETKKCAPGREREGEREEKERRRGETEGITIRKCVPTLFELLIFHTMYSDLVSSLLDAN